MDSVWHYECVSGSYEVLTQAQAGYYGDGSTPRVGEVYYTTALLAVVGNACVGGAQVVPEIFLPQQTVLAISASFPVRCVYTTLATGAQTELARSECPQTPSAGPNGGYAFYQPAQTTFPVPYGKVFELWVPVLSKKTLGGIGTNDYFQVGIKVISESTYTQFPKEGVFVFANPPTISYSAPSTSAITDTTATSKGVISNHYTQGALYADLGTSTAYTLPGKGPFAIGDYDWGQATIDWTGLSPGTAYHWRLRFVSSTGATTLGADQTFTTTGTAATRELSARALGHLGRLRQRLARPRQLPGRHGDHRHRDRRADVPVHRLDRRWRRGGNGQSAHPDDHQGPRHRGLVQLRRGRRLRWRDPAAPTEARPLRPMAAATEARPLRPMAEATEARRDPARAERAEGPREAARAAATRFRTRARAGAAVAPPPGAVARSRSSACSCAAGAQGGKDRLSRARRSGIRRVPSSLGSSGGELWQHRASSSPRGKRRMKRLLVMVCAVGIWGCGADTTGGTGRQHRDLPDRLDAHLRDVRQAVHDQLLHPLPLGVGDGREPRGRTDLGELRHARARSRPTGSASTSTPAPASRRCRMATLGRRPPSASS